MSIFERIETVDKRLKKANLNDFEDRIRKLILIEFAQRGKAPKIGEIAGMYGYPLEMVKEAVRKLEEADVLAVDEDEITFAYPFSASKTNHAVVFEDGRKVYALCATDALGIHFMLNEPILIVSECPYCRRKLEIKLEDGKIAFYEPDEIVKYVAIEKKCGCSAKALCPFINFFCSREHLEKWKKDNLEYAGGEVYSVEEAVKYGKSIFENLLR